MVQNIESRQPESTEQSHVSRTTHNGLQGNPHAHTIQTQNSQFTNQTSVSTVDENSLEAAPQTEIPPSPAINGVVQAPLTVGLANGHVNGMMNGHVENDRMMEEVNGEEEHGMENDESLNLQASPGSTLDEDKAKRYPFGNANCMPFKRTNVPPPERATRLPVSRIKNIMKFDPDVNIITQEAAYLVAKCTEQFVEGFAKAAYESTQTNKRKTLQKKDIENAVLSEERYTFLDGIEMGNGS